MKKNMKKIPAILVTLIMIASAMVVLNFTTPTVSATYSVAKTPGLDKFEGGNFTVGDYPLNTTLADLKYNYNANIIANGVAHWESGTTYYLWYPVYTGTGSGGHDFSLSWAQYSGLNALQAPSITPNVDLTFGPAGAYTNERVPLLNRSGLWLIGPSGMTPDAHNLSQMNKTIPAWFWVNTSTSYELVPSSIEDFSYDSTGSLSLTTKMGTDAVESMIAVVASNGRCVATSNEYYDKVKPVIESKNASVFTMAGVYSVYAYWDADGVGIAESGDQIYYYNGYSSHYNYYSSNYANNSNLWSTATLYNFSFCGPWDPPEYNATVVTFTVTATIPHIKLTNTTTVYWGLKKRIDVNVTKDDGTGITGGTILLRKTSGSIYYNGTGTGSEGTTNYLTKVWINETGKGNYSIEIPRIVPFNDYDWNILGNTSWYVYFVKDEGGTSKEEWNTTGTAANKFKIIGTSPPVQLTITDDGDGNADGKVDVPAYNTSGSGTTPTRTIKFTIYGTSISDNLHRAYYGDNPWEDWRNITVSGDILYAVDGTTLVHPAPSGGDWIATVTPTKPGGSITIKIDWPGSNNGTATQTIDIINGTSVVCSVPSFSIGAETTLTFTVSDIDGNHVPTANVYLWWEGGAQFNNTVGTGKLGNGKDGSYSRIITTTDQGTSAPKNITIGVKDQNYGFWGYTKVTMEKRHNMNVTITPTPTTSYAGDPTEYNIAVGLLSGGHPDKDSRGGLHIMIYDENGDLVTDPDIVSGTWPIDNQYSITDLEIILAGGTYHLYAYNDSHDSQGNNATITVTKYTVESIPGVLAWLIDTDVNVSFQLTPAGNGTLTLHNVSGTEAAIAGDSETVDIEDGIGTFEGLNASTLGNITFSYSPASGDDRLADAKDGKILKVTTATASPSPPTIYLGEPTTVTVTVTHPATGVPLEGIRVGMDHGLNLSTTILSKLPKDSFTNAIGQVQFSLTADVSGEITIYIKNESDPNNKFVINAEARNTMVISTDVPTVDENTSFTVEAKSGGALITDKTVTITFAGQTYTTATGTITLNAPKVDKVSYLDYTIEAKADGYTDATATIKVVNVPKITIILPSGKVYGNKDFTVTVADDAGSAVIGAKVTFNGADYYTGAGGSVTITAPDVKATSAPYTLTATFTGFKDASPVTMTIYKTQGGIPGFELVTLIAAIGVALILLRRRRN